MPSLKRMLTFQVRKKRRFKARHGLYVVVGNSPTPNQVFDINMKGLSFYYVDQGTTKPKKTSNELALLTYNDLLVGKIPYIRVSDVESAEIMFHSKKIKRQSVRFGRLTFSQKSKLRDTIRKFT